MSDTEQQHHAATVTATAAAAAARATATAAASLRVELLHRSSLRYPLWEAYPWRLNLVSVLDGRLLLVGLGDRVACYPFEPAAFRAPAASPLDQQLQQQTDGTRRLHVDRNFSAGAVGQLRPLVSLVASGHINCLATGKLGGVDVAVAVCEDKYLALWLAEHIFRLIDINEETPSSTNATLPLVRPLFLLNVNKSAWGVSLHDATAQIAVSTNEYMITIFNLSHVFRDGKLVSEESEPISPRRRQHQLAAPVNEIYVQPIRSHDSNEYVGPISSKVLSGHQHNVPFVSFSECGRFVASASIDFTCKLWNTEAASVIRTTTIPRRWCWTAQLVSPYHIKRIMHGEQQQTVTTISCTSADMTSTLDQENGDEDANEDEDDSGRRLEIDRWRYLDTNDRAAARTGLQLEPLANTGPLPPLQPFSNREAVLIRAFGDDLLNIRGIRRSAMLRSQLEVLQQGMTLREIIDTLSDDEDEVEQNRLRREHILRFPAALRLTEQMVQRQQQQQQLQQQQLQQQNAEDVNEIDWLDIDSDEDEDSEDDEMESVVDIVGGIVQVGDDDDDDDDDEWMDDDDDDEPHDDTEIANGYQTTPSRSASVSLRDPTIADVDMDATDRASSQVDSIAVETESTGEDIDVRPSATAPKQQHASDQFNEAEPSSHCISIGDLVLLSTRTHLYLVDPSRDMRQLCSIRVHENSLYESLPSGAHQMERLVFVHWLPELSVVVATSQNGLSSILRLVVTSRDNVTQNTEHQHGSNHNGHHDHAEDGAAPATEEGEEVMRYEFVRECTLLLNRPLDNDTGLTRRHAVDTLLGTTCVRLPSLENSSDQPPVLLVSVTFSGILAVHAIASDVNDNRHNSRSNPDRMLA